MVAIILAVYLINFSLNRVNENRIMKLLKEFSQKATMKLPNYFNALSSLDQMRLYAQNLHMKKTLGIKKFTDEEFKHLQQTSDKAVTT
jgi:hypothetical protein